MIGSAALLVRLSDIEVPDPAVEGGTLPGEPLAAQEEARAVDVERIAPEAAVAPFIDALRV